MSRNLRGRLDRLERAPAQPDAGHPPPDFWAVVGGYIPYEQASPETRRIFEEACQRADAPDPIEAEIAALEALPDARTKVPPADPDPPP